MSYRTLSAKPLNKSLKTLLRRTSHIGLGLGAFTPVLALANPTGGQVVAGQASITTPSANGLVVHQGSQSAIINWQQFNIGSGEYVTFQQPSSSSVVLNRVVGGSPTSILGNLNANGQVFLVNTNGVFFGHGASVDAQGFLASSLDINNSDFLAKNYVFNKSGNGSATVVNQGNIIAHRGGYVVLAGDYAENDGIVDAQSGHVVLAAGAKSTLTLQGNSLVSYVVNGATLASLAGAKNAGQLLADGGTVIMTADVANALKATVVNNTGLVEARSISRKNGGIYLTALGGNLVNAGTLNADAMNAGHSGGNIVLKGDGLTNLTNTSKISAQGMGADGGHVELSGNVLNVRGVANIGKRGSLLLDPGTMSIDITNPATGSNNQNSAGTGGTGVGHMSVGFIQTTLNNGTQVDISAAAKIEHSAGVTAITATTGAGNLGFKVGTNGHVDMGGVNINIKGNLTAHMGYGSFGHLQAGSINLGASHSLRLARAVENSHGVVTKQSVLSTKGTVILTAASNGIGSAEGSGEAGLAVKAKTGLDINGNINISNNINLVGQTVDDHGNINATGNINVTASAGYASVVDVNAGGNASVNAVGHTLTFQSNGYAKAGGNLTLNAKTISQIGNAFDLTAGGDLTVKGAISLAADSISSPFPHQVAHDLNLTAGGTIKLDHSVSVPGGITVTADHLAYTGKVHTFTMSAGYGNLLLDASIGSAVHAANYNVNLKDHGYGVFLQRSIHLGTASGAAANLSAIETGSHGLPTPQGVLVGDPHGAAVNLAATGNITLSGWNVGVGSVLSSHHTSDYGPVTIAAGKNISMTGNGSHGGHGGDVTVAGGKASHSGSDHNDSILITAGGNISMTAQRVSIRGGVADASNDADNATITLKATGKVTLTGGNAISSGNSVDVSGGSARAFAGDSGTANANATVSISGNTGVTLHATHVHVNGGTAAVAASAEAGAAAKATANAGVQIASKSGNIVLSALSGASAEGGTVNMRGGNAGFGGHAHASGEAATATATAHADVSLNAGGVINFSAFRVHVSGGSGAGAQSVGTIAATHTVANALGSNAKATFTATNGVNLTAGAGGINITGGDSVGVQGGNAALNHASVTGHGGGHASASGDGVVTFLTTGNLNVTTSSGQIRIHGGSSVAARSRANGASYGAAALNANGEVKFTAATVTINAKNGSAFIGGGGSGEGSEGAAQLAGASAESGGKATITGLADVAITTTTGALNVTAKHQLTVRGGQDAAAGQERFFTSSSGTVVTSTSSTKNVHNHHPQTSYAFATADNSGATATLTGKSGVALTAKGGLTLTQTTTTGSSRISIGGGSSAGAVAHLEATGGATATLTGNEGVAMKAANIAITGHNVHIFGARHGARGASTGYGSNFVRHHHNATSSHGSTSSHTSTSFTSTQPQVNHAGGANSKLTLNADTSMSLQAGTISLTANDGNLGLFAGSYGGTHVRMTASNSGSAMVTDNTSLTIKANTAFTATAKGANGVLQIAAANAAGFGAHVGASGEGGVAKFTVDGQVNITAPTVSLTAGHQVLLFGGNREGSEARVTAGSSASALLTTETALNVAGAKGVTIGLSGSGNGGIVALWAGSGGGKDAFVETTGHGQATIIGSGDVNVTTTAAGTGITVQTGKHNGATLYLNPGSDQGSGASVAAYGGAATETVSASLNLIAPGTVSVTAAKGNVDIADSHFNFSSSAGFTVGGFNGRDAHVNAPGGAATFTANDNVNITAATITMTAGSFLNGSNHASGGSITMHTGLRGNAESAHAFAGSHGVASFAVSDQLNLKATGKLTLTAAGDLDVGSGCCTHHVGAGAKATASGSGAKANLNLNESTSLLGTAAVSITAGGDISLTTVSGASGPSASAGAVAKAKGTAALSEAGQLNIVTNGAFTMKAGGDASLGAGLGARDGYATASGGSATATNTNDESFNITASSVLITAGNDIDMGGGSGVAWDATATAKHGGIATVGANRSMNVIAKSAITMMLTGNGNNGSINIGDGSTEAVGFGAEVFANSHGGNAKVVANGSTNLTVTATGGTITLSAGSHKGAAINVRAAGVGEFSFSSAPRFAGANAGVGGSASLNLVGNTNLSAKGAILVNAGVSGNLLIAPSALDMADGQVDASGGKATVNAQSVVNIAGGSVTLTAGHDITVTGASEVARGTGPSSHFLTHVEADNGGIANMNVQTGVKITTAGAFTATAGSSLDFVANGQSSDALTAASATVIASHGGAQATLTATNTIQVTAATVALTATAGSMVIAGGSSGGERAHILAGARSRATVNVDDSVNLTATGNFTAKAGAKMFIAAGASAAHSASMNADNRGIAKLSDNASVNIKAGGILTVAAGGDLDVTGGDRASPSINAQSGGSGSAAVNAGVNLSAGKSVAITAGGNLLLKGGGSAELLADEFFGASSHFSPAPKGKVKGTLNTGVNLTAHSSAALTAGGNLTIAAGDGETVAVGTFREHVPHGSGSGLAGDSWAGGSANLNANVGAAVTVGKNLTLTAGKAGAGSLQVLGLGANPHDGSGIENIVSARGGSSRAVANVTMTGNALVTAGGTITVNAVGDASIVGGIINDVRVDHAVGNVSLTGSADAGLHAGVDVVLNNIGGSLTLVGADAGPSEQGMLVDAHGNGGTAVAVGHADAAISAGRDIVTVHTMGGGLNLIGGDLVDAVALGSASNQHANGTANATLNAGRNITLSGAGDLNLLGGQFGAASASGGSHFVGTGSRTAVLHIHAGVTAGSAATLKFIGNGFVAGGNSVAASVAYNAASFDTGTATADAGVSITGKSVSVSVGGDLLVRGGSGAKATTVLIGGGNVGSASVDAGVKVSATHGNLAFTVGGAASFLGGSGVGGKAINVGGHQGGTGTSASGTFGINLANATAKADVNINATGTIGVTLTGTGNLLVAGAPDAEAFGTDAGGVGTPGRLFPANFGKLTAPGGHTNVTASGMVMFTAGGAITVAQHGGDLTILGGSNAASFASAQAIGNGAKTTMTVNANVLMQAGGILTFTGADNVTISAGRLPSSGAASPIHYITASGAGASVTEKLDSSVKLTGTTVSIAHSGAQNTHSSGHFSSSGFTQSGSISITSAAAHVLSVNLNRGGVMLNDSALQVAPATSGLSFGGIRPLTAARVTVPRAITESVMGATPESVNVQTKPMTLSTLQSTSLVPSLVSLVGTDAGGDFGAPLSTRATLFTPALDASGYSKAFSSSCTALVVQGSNARCSKGDK